MRVEGDPIEGLEWGNASGAGADGGPWIVGFSQGLRPFPLRYMPKDAKASEICIKLREHPKGDPEGKGKPVSTGRTISILAGAGGCFRLKLWRGPGRPVVVTLDEPGDFCVWGAGLGHEWEVPAPSTVVTIRWIPEAERRAP